MTLKIISRRKGIAKAAYFNLVINIVVWIRWRFEGRAGNPPCATGCDRVQLSLKDNMLRKRDWMGRRATWRSCGSWFGHEVEREIPRVTR